MSSLHQLQALYGQLNFGPSYHFPDISNIFAARAGTYQNPIVQVQGARTVGYYNSGFLSGLGGVLRSVGPYIAAAGSIAAEVLPAIYHTGSGAAQAPAGGPTATPVMAKPSMQSTAIVKRTPIQKIEQIMDPTQLGGPVIGTVSRGRYGTPGEKGFHMIKRGPHAGMWTRNRHRNVANIHALRRSLSRIHGFEKICRKVVRFVHPRRATGHAVFKRRRRS